MASRRLIFSPRTRALAVVACGIIAIGATFVYVQRRRRGNSKPPAKESAPSPRARVSAAGEAEEVKEPEADQSALSSTSGVRVNPNNDDVRQEANDSAGSRERSTISRNAVQSFHRGRFLTSRGVKKDLLQEDGGVVEGGFGRVSFFATRSEPKEKFALKRAKNNPAGRRQMRRELEFFADRLSLTSLQNVVRVADLMQSPAPMLLMYREEATLADMLEVRGETDMAAVARVLDGALLGVEELLGMGYFHRDIKPENILVGEGHRGILADFGLCLHTKEALCGKGVGDGTPEYTAPETVVSGWNLPAEIYAVFACFTEAVVGRCLFAGEELQRIRGKRIADVKAAYEDSREDLKYVKDDVAQATDDISTEEMDELRPKLESALDKVANNKIQLWRLQLDVGQGVPDDAASAKLASMGPPLSLFLSSIETAADETRRTTMCLEAKRQPTRLFEEGWIRWIPSSSKKDLREEVQRTMNFVLGAHALDPDPASRPQTVAEARQVLKAAAATYEGTD